MPHLTLAFRTLFKTPFVSIVAIVSLALGIGANAALYSLLNETLLQPLPVPQPERLVNLAAGPPQNGPSSCNQSGPCGEVFSYPMFRDLEKANTAFSGIAGHFLFGANIGAPGQTAVNGDGVLVSGSYFPVLGLRPALGRLFTPADDQVIDGEFIAVVSYSFWATQLGGAPDVIDRPITINGKSMTVVGVAPKGFTGTTRGVRPYVFVPLSMSGAIYPGWPGAGQRYSYWVYLFGRLKPDATIEQANASVNAAYHTLINDVDVPSQSGRGMSAKAMAEFRAKRIVLSDGRKGQSSMIGETRSPLTLLFAITVVVLLIACANIANLLLARAAARAMEVAVRLSLGATRRQLIGQVLTESILLASLGGLVSIRVAYWTLGGITALLPAEVGSAVDYSLSGRVVAFAAALSLATGWLFGIVPAVQSTRPDLVTVLRNQSGSLAGGRGIARFRASLVTAQIALSMALLISAGLFIKSLRNIAHVDLGIRIDNVVTFGISPGRSGYDATRTLALYGRVEDALAGIPGVSGVTSSGVPVLSSGNWGEDVSVEGFPKDPDTDDGSRYNAVGPNYFRVLGVPMLAGRDFTASDNAVSMKVAIVNEAFAKKFRLGLNAVGKHMSMANDSLNITIVGLAKNSKYSEVKDSVPPVFVRPYRQTGRSSRNTFYVRSALPPEQTFAAIAATMKAIDPGIPIERLTTLSRQAAENVYMDRMISTLSAAFAVLATLLAAVGLYGVLAYTVTQQTREIGVRMALGANGGRIRGMVLKQVGIMTLVGGAIGIAAALALGKAAGALLFELAGTDLSVITLAAMVLTVVAFVAGLIPATRASRIDPVRALRSE